MIRWLFVLVVGVHGLIHLLGFVKAFGWAELPQLTQFISRTMGLGWLAAGLTVLATALLVIAAPRVWWLVGLAAVVLSQGMIVSAWDDAKFGTLANVILLAGVIYGFASQGPLSFRAAFDGAVRERARATPLATVVTEADLAGLPLVVQQYLRVAGAVGQPRIHDVRATSRGRIRSAPDAPWMEFEAVQHNFLDEPARFFLMSASRGGLPVDVYHAFRDQSATMRVRLLSLFPIVSAGGAEMTRAETVTLLNDLCWLAPAALVDPALRWEAQGPHSARVRYTVGVHTVEAVLSFNDAHELVDFVSDDRLMASPDGTSFTRRRWSTPFRAYANFGPRRVATRGQGQWHAPEGEFAYIEVELVALEINVSQ